MLDLKAIVDALSYQESKERGMRRGSSSPRYHKWEDLDDEEDEETYEIVRVDRRVPSKEFAYRVWLPPDEIRVEFKGTWVREQGGTRTVYDDHQAVLRALRGL